MNFELKPHVGLGPVELGMTKDQVIAAIGPESFDSSHGNLEYYFAASLQVEFTDGLASFIGASYSDSYTVIYKNKDVFDLSAEEVFDLIAIYEGEKHIFNDEEYVFPNQIITLWDADKQYDYKGLEKRKVWAQIGLGSSKYLNA